MYSDLISEIVAFIVNYIKKITAHARSFVWKKSITIIHKTCFLNLLLNFYSFDTQTFGIRY